MSMKRISAAAVVLAFGVVGASAQDWAKQSLEKSPRHQEWVEIQHDSRVVHAFIVYPEVKQKTPAGVVIHEVFVPHHPARCAAGEPARRRRTSARSPRPCMASMRATTRALTRPFPQRLRP